MNQDLHETEQTRIVDFDAWDLGLAGKDGASQTLEEGEIDMDLQGLSFEGGEPVGDGKEFGADGREMLKAFFKKEVFQIIATDFDS